MHWTSDITRTETDRLTWVFTHALYPALRSMTAGMPTPIYLPHLPTGATSAHLHSVAVRLDRIRRIHLPEQDLPADVLTLAETALYNAVGAAHLLTEPMADTGILAASIEAAQSRVRAVEAFIGIQPEEAGAPDTLAEMEI